MNQITSTVISVSSTGNRYVIPTDMTKDQVVQAYSTSVPGLSDMVCTETVANGTRTLSFSPRQGSKG